MPPLKTTIALGAVRVPVSLTKTTMAVREPEFVAAGPSGGPLVLREPEGGSRVDPFASPRSVAKTSPPPPQVLVEEGTGESVEPEQVRTGVRLDDGRFVDCTDRLAAIAEDTILDEIEVLGFVPLDQVPRERITGAYWLAPGDASATKFVRLVGDGMREVRRAAVVRWTKRTRQSVGLMVRHRSGALMVWELEFASRVREPHAAALAPQMIEVSDRELAAARRLISAMSGPISLVDDVEDEAVRLRRELFEEALSGSVGPVAVADPEPVPDVISEFERAAGFRGAA